jgi:hypothetical protein
MKTNFERYETKYLDEVMDIFDVEICHYAFSCIFPDILIYRRHIYESI